MNEREQLKIESKVTNNTFDCVYMLHCEKSGKIKKFGHCLLKKEKLAEHTFWQTGGWGLILFPIQLYRANENK